MQHSITSRHVPGEGLLPCDLMIIGDRPGYEETKYGRPFVGKSGKELNRYVFRATGRTRTSCYATYLTKFYIAGDDDATSEDIQRDSQELSDEIAYCNPSFIACLGRLATNRFLGDADMDSVHGVPYRVDGRIVVPIIDPAAGLHSTEFQAKIAWDFDRLGQVMRGQIKPEAPYDAYGMNYQDVLADVFLGLRVTQPAGVDTEGSIKKPWGLSLSTKSGVALNVRYAGPDQGMGVEFQDRVIMHNAIHDIAVLRSMGIEIRDDQFDDTMIMAYLLCIEPQGLKPLAYRHCGMLMKDYQDLTSNASKRHAADYMDKVVLWLSKRLVKESHAYKVTVSKPPSGRQTKKSTSAKGGPKLSKTASRRK